MNILVITSNNPFQIKTGSANIARNQILWLKKKYSVETINISDYKKTKNKIAKYFYYFINLLVGIPVSVSSMHSKKAKRDIKEIIKSKKIDIIIAFEISTIQYCPKNLYHKLIVNIEDPQSLKLQRLTKLKTIKNYKKIIHFVNYKVTRSYEKAIFPKIKKILLLSKSDIEDIKKDGHNNVDYVTYGTDFPDTTETLGYKDREKTIIISGNMNHEPNIDGVLFFIEKVFPQIRKKGDLKLIIVGANPDKRIIESIKKFENYIKITGRVENISDYIKKSLISVCPVMLKVGVQTKILEALVLGTPVVTTSAGNSGVAGKDGIDLLVEDDAEKMAQKIIKLTDINTWNILSENGKSFIRKEFNWEKSFFELDKYINEIYNQVIEK